ncbi:hypothetical protein GCM10009836_03390 [Pseudonocardia ailaonensis]|uniref:Sec-independent protein translocase protein TatB n=1 Tax=Pseudonocardia ailaonensis TaxID=367279 RepID=A0ABN2MLS4_9PSEU
MFESVGWGEIVVIVLAGLFILGPERLPGAASWLARNIRKAKDFAAGANEQIRKEVGPELDELRKPLADLRAPLQELRSLRSPRAALMTHLLSEPERVKPVSAVLPDTAPVPPEPAGPESPVPTPSSSEPGR